MGPRFLQNGIHTISSIGRDQKMRKLCHNELSENYVMEGEIGGKAFKAMVLAFSFLLRASSKPAECVHSLLGCPLQRVSPLGPTCLLLCKSTPSCSSATSNILLLFFTFVLCACLPVPLRVYSEAWLHAACQGSLIPTSQRT